ncbi:hypothetical protein [Knoellia subterranea]|uniref:Uncharacterized protein n=1 Tax=Knoellia subterranea KCTC 19937 TaxID=1385521 RepID=A0A0A0JMS0_9MICO|nr:hypothetical protein [Knoellia subterranea]KGN36921.1 hypothetical protein N803_16025 [Knoellia subterranea KCTC 19937]
MHHHNHYYGHSHILARYCGLPQVHPPRIRGYLQHGWNVGDGWNPQHEFFDGAWRWTWSDAPRRRGHILGRRNYQAIGAPWLYLLDLEPDLGVVPEEEREGTLFFLFHGWEGGKIEGDHKRLIDEIRETEPGPVTFSLYYTEYERPEIRNSYLDAGFDVVSFGKRGFAYEGTDRRFLFRQLKALRKHKRVAANRLATAVFYGASVGCDVAVYGDPMAMNGEDPLFGGNARVQRLWPELHGKDLDQVVAREVVNQELGTAWKMPAQELRPLIFDGVTHD